MALYTFTPRRDNAWIWLPILGVLLAFPVVMKNEYILNVGVLAGIYVILTMGLNITNGWTGLMSFGYAAFYGIGAYTAGILATRYAVLADLSRGRGGGRPLRCRHCPAHASAQGNLPGAHHHRVPGDRVSGDAQLDEPHARSDGHPGNPASQSCGIQLQQQPRLFLSDPGPQRGHDLRGVTDHGVTGGADIHRHSRGRGGCPGRRDSALPHQGALLRHLHGDGGSGRGLLRASRAIHQC